MSSVAAVAWRRESELNEGLPDPCAFYHVHSFAPRPSDPDAVLGTATYGTEFGGAEGIGLLKGRVEQLDANGLKVPQIGWNPVAWRRESPLTDGLPDPCAFYHANSFAPRPANAEDVLGTADYGGEFVSVVERPPVYGLQSHPEKSGPDGLRLLRSFAGLCVGAPA